MAKKKQGKSSGDPMSDFMDKINKTFGSGSIMSLEDQVPLDINKRIPTGIISLDNILGGGFPLGRIIEIYGPEASGKTTLALHALIGAQIKYPDDYVYLVDAEHSFDRQYAQHLGLNIGKCTVSQPDNGETALDFVEYAIDSHLYKMIVVDSVAALTPQSEIDGEMGDSNLGKHARLMSQAMRKLTAKLNKSDCNLIFINQLREKIGVMFGNPETTTGGNALKFYASIRIDIRSSTKIKSRDGSEVIGNIVKVKTAKNKTYSPFKVAELELYFGEGFSKLHDILKIAIDKDIIKRAGSWFSYGDTKLGQGQPAVIEMMEDNEEFVNELIEKINYVEN